jgi:outer membrane protein assembly factor BamD|tara:strand:- start:250 stop:1086 length:837 start_codon:yes stop_codon:yes gene_type:complete
MNNFIYLCILILFLLSSCSKDEKEISLIKESTQDLEIVASYEEAYAALDTGEYSFAAKKFLEAELLFPQSEWAPRSVLMASYSYYLQNYYAEALSNLERYIKTYPEHKDLAYANYLIAICYYETIEDEKRDMGPIVKAKNKFSFIVDEYPNSEFAYDAQFKLDLLQDLLASKEMYLGRHYMKKEKWIAAINRFKFVVDNYEQTVFIEEAIHRLVEINYKLGLLEESKKYSMLLGYNYLSSEWYKKTYKIFNKDYSNVKVNPIKKDKKGVINKFKKLFD